MAKIPKSADLALLFLTSLHSAILLPIYKPIASSFFSWQPQKYSS